jgi:zinc protease
MRARLLEPGWREDDFRRMKEEAINNIKVGLRNNDEELAKEVLYHEIYQGTPYGHYSLGTVRALEGTTLEDVQRFYRTHYSQSNLYIGIAGGYPQGFGDMLKKDFSRLPVGAGFRPRPKMPALIEGTQATIVEKDTRSVAISLGFPIPVTRAKPDYAALLLAASYFGQHRMSGGVLYNELREKRGLNYGDYAYIEYFPQGMYLMEPSPNLARHSQIFQIWIRPVEPSNAKFALRMALYQLDRLIREGIPAEAFERTRDFLTRYVNFLTRTQRAELGYAIDSVWYATSTYAESVKSALSKLTVSSVNRAIKSNLRTSRVVIAIVAKDAQEIKQQLASDDSSPMTYNSPKPEELTEVDRAVEKWPLNLRAEDIKIVPVGDVFANGAEIDPSRSPRGR